MEIDAGNTLPARRLASEFIIETAPALAVILKVRAEELLIEYAIGGERAILGRASLFVAMANDLDPEGGEENDLTARIAAAHREEAESERDFEEMEVHSVMMAHK